MAQKGQLSLADPFSRQNPGQHQVQRRNAMMQGAGRHPQQGYFSQISHQEHGAGQHRGAVVHLRGPGQADAVAGDIIRVDAHAAAQQQQVAAPQKVSADGLGDGLGIIRGKVQGRHLRPQSFDFRR